MLSGNESSCYQATKSAANPRQHRVSRPSNFPNLNSLTFSRSAAPRWITATRPQAQQQKPGLPTRRAAP
ncbi:MAG: hypothetical protein EPO53_20285 [Variovorax sp.]|nr:MAG: hypothetical protein EPO53_20285 [Variovorax sp.]